MRYIIDRKTNEHERYDGQNYDATKYRIVDADSEGWIAWDCEADLDCPISEEQPYQARLRSGSIVDSVVRWDCYNNHGDVLEYRPILEPEKVQERAEKEAERKHMEIKEAEHKRMMLLDRLKAAHKAVQTIPDLEAELRRELAGMGYTLGMMNPFVEPANSTANKNQCMLAAEMAKNIKEIILTYEDQIPLALAIGVLEIVKKELIEDNA